MKKNSLFLLLGLAATFMLISCNKNGGMQKTISGFDVQLVKDEKGDVAKEGDYVYFRYHVVGNDSLIFSSTMQTPVIKFKLPKLEKQEAKNAQPMLEAIHLMSIGDSAVVYQPLDEEMKKSVGLPHINKIEYHVALVDIKNEEAYKADMEVEQKAADEKKKMLEAEASVIAANAKTVLADYKAGKLASSLVTTPSGLKYLVHEAGNGPKAEPGKPVSVHYYGMLMDGTRFDDSWSRGQEFQFMLGQRQVIPGWDEGVANLNQGAKATLFIPAALAYGAEGAPPAIPANAELMFYIEVKKVN